MKTKIIATISVLSCLSLMGQLEAGRKLVSVSLSYQTQTNFISDKSQPGRDQKQQNKIFSGTIKTGKFVKDKLMWGTYLGEQFLNAKTEVQTRSNSRIFEVVNQNTYTHSLGTFLRLYKMPFKNALAVYVELSADGGYQDRRAATYKGLSGMPLPNYGNSERGTIFNFNVTGGLVYFLNHSWALEATCTTFNLTYRDIKSYNGGTYYRQLKSLNTNINLSLSAIVLGVNYYFGKPRLKKTSP